MIDNEDNLYINEYSLYMNRIYMLNALPRRSSEGPKPCEKALCRLVQTLY